MKAHRKLYATSHDFGMNSLLVSDLQYQSQLHTVASIHFISTWLRYAVVIFILNDCFQIFVRVQNVVIFPVVKEKLEGFGSFLPERH